MSVDDATARQSRRAANPVRFRDGSLRPDRPRPPPGSLPAPQMSPRPEYQKLDHVMYWDTGGAPLAETTSKAGYSPREALSTNLIVPTRHALSPRYARSTIGDIVFGDKTNHAAPNVPLPMMPSEAAAASMAASPRYGTPRSSQERQIIALEAAVRHEKRKADLARARMITNLRAGIIVDPVGLHDPAAQP